MKGVCAGTIPPPKGMTREQACEYVRGQSPKSLRDVAPKRKKRK